MGVIYRHKRLYGNNPNQVAIGYGGGYAPIGTIIAFMGTNAPQDYLPCDGGQYFINDFPQLTNFFEIEFGAVNYFGGNGTTTFAVPDLRGEFLRGTGTNAHANQGNGTTVGNHQDATSVPNFVVSQSNTRLYGYSKSSTVNANVQNADNTLTGTGYIRVDGNFISNTSQDAEYTARPTNTSVLWCIKAVGMGTGFSGMEHYVGEWVNHKPLYEITITGTTITTNEGTISTGLHNIDYCELVDFQVSNGTYRRNLLDSVAIKEDGTEIKMVADSESLFKNKAFTATILFTKSTD